MKSKRSPCLDLMIKYASKTMDVTDYLLLIRVHYKKQLSITIQKCAHCGIETFLDKKLFDFFIRIFKLVYYKKLQIKN